MTSGISFVTAGDPHRLTGGNLYNRRVVQAIHRAGLTATETVLPLEDPLTAGRMLRAHLIEQRPALVVVDSIALDAAAPFAVWIRHYLGARLLALMHMAPSAIAPEWRKSTLQRVRFCVPLRGEDLGRRYASTDAFVLPSASESFGIVYAEAMSFGLPVIACRVGPLPWLVEGDCGILVPIDDAGTLAAAMQTIASDASRRRCMSQAALRRTACLPTWRESADRFAGLLHDMLSAPRGRYYQTAFPDQ